MALVELDLDALQEYRPEVAEPADFDAFWDETLATVDRLDLDPTFTPIDNHLALIDSYDVVFTGWGGTRVRAWLHVPAGTQPGAGLPCVVQFQGYSGSRGLPYADTVYAQAGWAHLIMDTRGQGWSTGGVDPTPDDAPEAGIHHSPGFMTAGIADPHTYYYRRVYVDTVRALQTAATSPLVDPGRLLVTGASQGGGLSIAAAGLAPRVGIRLLGSAPDVPFLCHFRRAVALTDAHPYGEITQFLAGWRDQVPAAERTLSYFDGVNLARRADAPTLFSAALMDPVCPPSTVFAAYHAYAERTGQTDKHIAVYSHNGHEGGGPYQLGARLAWIADRFA
ncbi:cephalosporin-C deacetylase [Friedmanniella endophytica]|uniref:Cephalosporin-C deacetylase n=1 Tax=Microlunatus kandeliicorticis TaxID=1759536 RepID=A0A7W3IP63_9ACTN|nr:acetylxylan esterase [Microlunatus kandeliicorticis]MBA8792681.1 cephalosporin-C deacetylase [Microlunatus kandeliicorticis]